MQVQPLNEMRRNDELSANKCRYQNKTANFIKTYMLTMKRFLTTIAIFCICSSFVPKEITWIAIGDSITYLNEHLKETGNRVSKGYMTRVTERLPYIHYVNQGHNGWTSG